MRRCQRNKIINPKTLTKAAARNVGCLRGHLLVVCHHKKKTKNHFYFSIEKKKSNGKNNGRNLIFKDQ